MLGSRICFQMCLEISNFLPFYKSGTIYYFLYATINIRLDMLILRLQIHHLYFFHTPLIFNGINGQFVVINV